MATSFTISYGLFGGHSLGRRLRKFLGQKGYTFRTAKQGSDIVIAHSAGCFSIPTDPSPKLVFFVGMPISLAAPRQTFLQANRQNLKHFIKSYHPQRLAHIVGAGGYYGLREPRRNLAIIRHIKKLTPPDDLGCRYVFIASQHDPWQRSPEIEAYIEKYDWTFISLPGSHDDIWDHPERYVAIIDHYARLLA